MTHSRWPSWIAAGAFLVAAAGGLSAHDLPGAERLTSSVAAAQGTVHKKKPSPYAMTGCLQKGDDGLFRLTNVEGGGAKTIDIVGTAKTANLAAHIGHRIEVTGTTVNAKKAAKAEGKTTKDVKAARGLYMRVRSVKMLAATCS